MIRRIRRRHQFIWLALAALLLPLLLLAAGRARRAAPLNDAVPPRAVERASPPNARPAGL